MSILLKPYNEMNTEEVMIHWKRVRYAHCLGLYESPNHVLWELINESKRVTLQRWDTNTGAPYEKQKIWGSNNLNPKDRDPTVPDRSLRRTLLELTKPAKQEAS